MEGGRQWALFLARQIKDKTGNAAAKKKALERKLNPKADSNYMPTSCDDYTDEALHKWFEERDFATNLMLSLNKNRLASLGSNFCDYTKLGFRDEAGLKEAHKAVDLAYLRKINRSACKLLHHAVFDHPWKETVARTKLHSILITNQGAEILKGAVDDDDLHWIDDSTRAGTPWEIPAVQIWDKIFHKYEGMADMLSGRMMEELAEVINCVTGDARQRRIIYEADQDFERFCKTLTANFKDTATLWEFLRASLRQCHIHKLSKVGKDRAA